MRTHIKTAGEVCGLHGVVKHRGATANSGHYTFLRKRSKEWCGELMKHEWFALDDSHVYGIKAEAVKDDAKGQCAMLLYQKMEGGLNEQ